MKNENEIQLKRAYWQGVFDALKTSRKGDGEKERVTAQVWVQAMDWILDKQKESDAKIQSNEEVEH
jgi:hypothetical protein